MGFGLRVKIFDVEEVGVFLFVVGIVVLFFINCYIENCLWFVRIVMMYFGVMGKIIDKLELIMVYIESFFEKGVFSLVKYWFCC